MKGFRKTVLLRREHKALKGYCDIAVVTNDICALENSGFPLKHYTQLAYRTLGVKTSITFSVLVADIHISILTKLLAAVGSSMLCHGFARSTEMS